MEILLPVLAVLSRVLVGFSAAFPVPLAWAWSLDGIDLARTWAGAFLGTAASGLVLTALMRRHQRELLPKDGFLLVVAVLPLMGLGGMQLYRAETPGPMKDAKVTPRIAETARGLWTVYSRCCCCCRAWT